MTQGRCRPIKSRRLPENNPVVKHSWLAVGGSIEERHSAETQHSSECSPFEPARDDILPCAVRRLRVTSGSSIRGCEAAQLSGTDGGSAKPRGKSADVTIWPISKRNGLGQPSRTSLGRKNRGPYWKPGTAGGVGCATLFRSWTRWGFTSQQIPTQLATGPPCLLRQGHPEAIAMTDTRPTSSVVRTISE